ncbi:MAG: hypothetical protein AB7Q17_02455 [Phycisphaerae bacterium]
MPVRCHSAGVRRAARRRTAAMLGATAGLLGLFGCAARESRMELAAFRDPYFPERIALELHECAYRMDAGGDYHVVARAQSSSALIPPGAAQLLHIRMFWRPFPGRSPAHASGVDAMIRLAVSTTGGAAVYSGTAFVYADPRKLRGAAADGTPIALRLERAELRLETLSGDATDTLGSIRAQGTVRAAADPNIALEVARQVDRAMSGPGGAGAR